MAMVSEKPSGGAPSTGRLPRRTIWLYGIGQASEGIKNYSFSSFLLFYYTSVLGLPGTLAGAAMMIALVFDAVTDPVVAVLSDRTRSRWGRRHPFILASALPLGVCFFLTFRPPSDLAATLGVSSETALFGWMVVFTVATRGAMTLFHVPHMALGAELSNDFDERTKVVSARSVSSIIGSAITVTSYFVLVAQMETPEFSDPRLNPAPYSTFAAIFGALITVSVLACFWGTRDRIAHLKTPSQTEPAPLFASLRRDLTQLFSMRAFSSLVLGYTLCYLAWGVTTSLGTHNAVYFWHLRIEHQGLQGLGLTLGLALGMPHWQRQAARSDKHPAFMRGMFCFTCFSALPPLLKVAGLFPPEDSAFYIPAIVFIGALTAFGIAAAMVLVGSMMADITDQDELLHGHRREGLIFGALSLANKMATGVGVIAAGAIYDAVGLVQDMDPTTAPPEISTRLGTVTGMIALVLIGSSLLVVRRYDLTRQRHAEIRAQLDERAAAL